MHSNILLYSATELHVIVSKPRARRKARHDPRMYNVFRRALYKVRTQLFACPVTHRRDSEVEDTLVGQIFPDDDFSSAGPTAIKRQQMFENTKFSSGLSRSKQFTSRNRTHFMSATRPSPPQVLPRVHVCLDHALMPHLFLSSSACLVYLAQPHVRTLLHLHVASRHRARIPHFCLQE